MTKKTISRIFALANFIVLLSVFLLYRGGYFDKKLSAQNIPNDADELYASNQHPFIDTIPPARLPSSKSIVLLEPGNVTATPDTQRVDTVIRLSEKEKLYLASSKSGAPLRPGTITLDSLVTKKPKHRKKRTAQQ